MEWLGLMGGGIKYLQVALQWNFITPHDDDDDDCVWFLRVIETNSPARQNKNTQLFTPENKLWKLRLLSINCFDWKCRKFVNYWPTFWYNLYSYQVLPLTLIFVIGLTRWHLDKILICIFGTYLQDKKWKINQSVCLWMN